MTRSYDFIVIGSGTMGASTCWHLARSGQRVLGLDRHEVPHGFGSHHGHSRMIRLSYFEHSDYVPLLKRSYELWGELESYTDQPILTRTGGLYMSPPDGVIVSGCVQASEEHGLAHEILGHDEICSEFPQFRLSENYRGFYEAAAGVLMVEPALQTVIDQTRRHGGEIRGGEEVLSWSVDGDSYRVQTQHGTYCSGGLVITGGAWNDWLLRDLSIPLRVTRQTMFWLDQKDRLPSRFRQPPAWFIETEPGKGLYGIPPLPGQRGMKLADHCPGKTCDPDNVDRNCSEEDWRAFRSLAAHYFSQKLDVPLSMQTCLYTSTPDGHFLVDRHPLHSSLAIGAGFCGHGFKFAPVMGEILSQLVLQGKSAFAIDFLGLNRFQNETRS